MGCGCCVLAMCGGMDRSTAGKAGVYGCDGMIEEVRDLSVRVGKFPLKKASV